MVQLLERARKGDPAATAAVVEQLRPRIEKMAVHYARCCGEDADDLLQDAWVGLLRALPVLNTGIGRPEQFLIKQARWRLLDAIRKAKLRRCLPLEEGADLPISGTGSCTPEPFNEAAAAQFVGRLKSGQRALLELLLAGFTWREAGSAMGCTSANVAYHMRQIRRLYQEWWTEQIGL
jgi:RNA polymerase sigma factor (sigma-70 family)